MKWKLVSLAAAVGTALGGGAARAAVVYNATAGTKYTNPVGPAPMLDDVTFALPANTPPLDLTGITFGARNADGASHTVDALVSFFDAANTSATGSQVVESGLLGTVRLSGLVVPASSASATFTRTFATPVRIPDGNAAVRITFVQTGGNTVSEDVDALLTSALPTVGSTVDKYWSDQGSFNQSFTGDEEVPPDTSITPPLHANFYLSLDGVAVPEPGALSLAGGAGLLMLRRRRAAR